MAHFFQQSHFIDEQTLARLNTAVILGPIASGFLLSVWPPVDRPSGLLNTLATSAWNTSTMTAAVTLRFLAIHVMNVDLAPNSRVSGGEGIYCEGEPTICGEAADPRRGSAHRREYRQAAGTAAPARAPLRQI